jgi:hypothetical protein
MAFPANGQVGRVLELVVLPNEMRLPDTRPVRRFHPRGMYCRVLNGCDQPLFVYGPRHPSDATTLPTSLFLLPLGFSTLRGWDCKGVLIPAGQSAADGSSILHGPVVLKYRDFRRVAITMADGRYQCPKSNGILKSGQPDFAIPLLPYRELLNLPRRQVPL